MKWRRPNQEADVAPVTNLSLSKIRSEHIHGAIRRGSRDPAARIPDSHPINTDEVFGTIQRLIEAPAIGRAEIQGLKLAQTDLSFPRDC